MEATRPPLRPSAALFCPQSKAPGADYLLQLQRLLTRHSHLQHLGAHITALADTWALLAARRPDIAALQQGPRYIEQLSGWVTRADAAPVANAMSGILSLPLLVVIQTCQYFQFLDLARLSHADFLAALRSGRGGAQGYCGGLLPAFAIACARDEADVVRMAAKAMRIALAIGAFGELGDDESLPGPTTVVVRLKAPGQGDEIVDRFPGCYISAVTDPKTVSVVGPVLQLQQLAEHAQRQGLLVSPMHIRGKVHNPENAELADALCRLCDQHDALQLPPAEALQVPVRSNRDGKLLQNCSLTHEAVHTILASRCEWFELLTHLAEDLRRTGADSHMFALYGIGDPVPLAPFHQLQLKITKLDVLGAVKKAQLADYAYPDDAVAVVGMSCRLPGANSLDELWELMANAKSTCEEIRPDRIPMHESFRATQDAKWAGKQQFYGNFVDHVEAFDNAFFRTNPKEAAHMDPQQRILLELAVQAMDSSGYLRFHSREAGDNVGCFIGASFVEYHDNTNAFPPTAYTATGMIRAFLCGRISYYFGWSGPAEVIDTACSSSLVAVNRAVRAVRSGECAMALAGGINIMSSVHNYMNLAKAGFLSPTGQCKPFDQAADGYCRADGAAMVVLKPLRRAVVDGDHVLGVIVGTATNQGGLSASITVPHSPAQMALYRNILDQAHMEPEHVSYVEAHGTGTQAGDPLEIASLREVFAGADRSTLLHVGSLKGNVGHCEAAAGIAGLIKVLAMLSTSSIPPLANFTSLNPRIPALAPDKMAIARKTEPWEAPLRAACVNSYGAAGSNAAVLCCEGPAAPRASGQQQPCGRYPILVTAATKQSLSMYREILGAFLARGTASIGNVAFTLGERRKRHRVRWTAMASSIDDVCQELQGDNTYFEAPQSPRRVVLAFGGQSRQNVGLPRCVYDSYPRLKHYVNACDDALAAMGFPSILPAIFDVQPISDVVVLQTATFAAQFACAKCWIDAGLSVDCTIGHSFGELTALAVSGVLSLEDGLKVVATRASLMASKWGNERGTMLAIHADRATVGAILDGVGDLEVACYNSPTSHVVVGSSASIARAEAALRKDVRFRAIRSQRLDVSHGFHSRFTEPLLPDLSRLSGSVSFKRPDIGVELCTPDHVDRVLPGRLAQHTREAVYFSDAVRRIEQRLGSCFWLEAGVDSPIIPMLKRAVSSQNTHGFQAIKFQDAVDASAVLPTAMLSLWREGLDASFWAFLDPAEAGVRPVWLPPYQFERTVAWLPNIDRTTEAQKVAIAADGAKCEASPAPPPLRLVTCQESSASSGKAKQFAVNAATKRFREIVSGHAVRGQPLCPASMYMECAVMAAHFLVGDVSTTALCFEDVSFEAPLGVDLTRDVSLTLEEADGEINAWSFLLASTSKADARSRRATHGKGRLRLTPQPKLHTYQRLVSDRIRELRSKPSAEKLLSKRAYGLFSQVVHYAEFLQGIATITMDGTQAVADIEVPAGHVGGDESSVVRVCDTVALDTFIQVAGLLINSSGCCPPGHVFVATGLDTAVFSQLCDFDRRKSWTVYAMFAPTGESTAAGDVFVLTKDDAIALTVSGVRFTRLPISKLEKLLESANSKPRSATPVPKPFTSIPRPEAVPELASDSDHDTAQSSACSDSGAPATPLSEDDGESSLRDIIAMYTGSPAAEIALDVTIGDLGVDSLAAVELAEDLKSRFGKELSSTDLLMANLEALSHILLAPVLKRMTAAEGDHSRLAARSASRPAKIDTGRRQRVLQILAESCGAQEASMHEEETLRDLGFDSLSSVELKSELEDAFSVELGDRVHLDSTVQEVLKLFGIGNAFPEPSQPPACSSPALRHNGDLSLPASLGDPIAALVECEAAFPSRAESCGFNSYWSTVAPKQDELLVAYILEAFKTLGADLWSLSAGQAVPAVNHLPKHTKVMQRFFDILSKHSIVKKSGDNYVRSSGTCPRARAEELLWSFMAQFPKYRCEATLMSLTGPKLANCLVGTDDPVALLFGSSQAQRVLEDFYTNSPMLATLTELLVDLIGKTVSASSGGTVRIVEVGAGFGGTTKRLAERLQASGCSIKYTFTDIASTLVRSAAKKLGSKYEWMEFHAFNLEHDAPAWMEGRFDIAIGTNCVHATANRAATMSRIKKLLNTEGFAVLSEVTEIIDWYDIVYGLLDGWWLSNDASYPLQSPDVWMRSFTDAGFATVTHSQGQVAEARSQRLLLASKKLLRLPAQASSAVDTVVYKEVDGVKIHADIYLPQNLPSRRSMPVALLLHGGGHMTLSRRAIRPAQVSFLLANGILAVSCDYRLCPEISVLDGPIADVRDAYIWTQTELPRVVGWRGISVDPAQVVVVGWSSGGQLAMSTAWTTKETALNPPRAVLSFYGPTDFESGDLDVRRAEEYPERQMALDQIIKALPTRPITSYDDNGAVDTTGLGWVRPGDPRSELVLSLFKEGNGLNLLLDGISAHGNWLKQPDTEQVAAISPMAQVRRGNYTTPTFLIHGEEDEIVPFDSAVRFVGALRERGIECGFLPVAGAKHIHDLHLKPGSKRWDSQVAPGYEFLFNHLILN